MIINSELDLSFLGLVTIVELYNGFIVYIERFLPLLISGANLEWEEKREKVGVFET